MPTGSENSATTSRPSPRKRSEKSSAKSYRRASDFVLKTGDSHGVANHPVGSAFVDSICRTD